MAANEKRRLYVDVSVLSRRDAGTGIQRVVKAIWLELIGQGARDFDVIPVAAAPRRRYRVIRKDFLDIPLCRLPLAIGRARLSPRKDDIFLGLDLAAHVAPKNSRQYRTWRRAGMTIAHVIYDLLPVQHPEWFNTATTENYKRWLDHVVKFSDGLICISQAVATDVADWIRDHAIGSAASPAITHVRFGGSIAASNPSCGLPANAREVIAWMEARPTVLMVGTIEPRKGYDQALAAFEVLWSDPANGLPSPQLVIVGRPGWKTDALQQRLRSHPLRERRVLWLDEASDEFLERLYVACAGLLVASRGEGLGLPLVEAAIHCKPILARDLPVFREVSPDAEFFVSETPAGLARAIEAWLENSPPSIAPRAQPHWKTAVDDLIGALGRLQR